MGKKNRDIDKIIDSLNLFDDDLMSRVFDGNIEATEYCKKQVKSSSFRQFISSSFRQLKTSTFISALYPSRRMYPPGGCLLLLNQTALHPGLFL